MKVTVFGATGGIGRQLIEQGLRLGHEMTAVVRRDVGIPGATVVRATLDDAAALEQAVAGRDAVLTALGHRRGGPPTVQADGARAAVAAMRATGVRRIVSVDAAGRVADRGDSLLMRVVAKPSGTAGPEGQLRGPCRGGTGPAGQRPGLDADQPAPPHRRRPPSISDGRRPQRPRWTDAVPRRRRRRDAQVAQRRRPHPPPRQHRLLRRRNSTAARIRRAPDPGRTLAVAPRRPGGRERHRMPGKSLVNPGTPGAVSSRRGCRSPPCRSTG